MIVEVTRGDLVESEHHVAACAVDARGNVVLSDGDVESPVYLRSSAKPFIAAAAVEAGVAERFGLTPREIAVMASSHFGEPFHVEAVRSILHKIGMSEGDLQCGSHYPYDEASAHALVREGIAPSPVYNNCSGKHAGILALCKTIGADTATYLELSNPAEQYILSLCARVSDDDAAAWPLSVDGCGIPVYATGLRKGALSFARLADPNGVNDAEAEALRTVRDAMIAHPEYVCGTGQLDTVLMQVGAGSIACKAGAEGVHAVGALPQKLGYASKVVDGTGRARGPSTVAALRKLGVLDEEKTTKLARFGRPIVYNRAHLPVGEIRVASPS
ncbi:MAG: asparaginase [Candidatus Eremiobacteraeota bacterium]|nr:asparaginase [Candidatus Eremiobacteraeota bacterium]